MLTAPQISLESCKRKCVSTLRTSFPHRVFVGCFSGKHHLQALSAYLPLVQTCTPFGLRSAPRHSMVCPRQLPHIWLLVLTPLTLSLAYTPVGLQPTCRPWLCSVRCFFPRTCLSNRRILCSNFCSEGQVHPSTIHTHYLSAAFSRSLGPRFSCASLH